MGGWGVCLTFLFQIIIDVEMIEVFRKTANDSYRTLQIANAIEGFPDCQIISINNLESNHWEIWARYDSDRVSMNTIDNEIKESLEIWVTVNPLAQ